MRNEHIARVGKDLGLLHVVYFDFHFMRMGTSDISFGLTNETSQLWFNLIAHIALSKSSQLTDYTKCTWTNSSISWLMFKGSWEQLNKPTWSIALDTEKTHWIKQLTNLETSTSPGLVRNRVEIAWMSIAHKPELNIEHLSCPKMGSNSCLQHTLKCFIPRSLKTYFPFCSGLKARFVLALCRIARPEKRIN